MRKLKITKIYREQLTPMKEFLKSEVLSLEVFLSIASKAEQSVDKDVESLVGYFQNLESSRIFAMSHLYGKSYEEMIAEERECGEEINKLRWLNARNVLAIAQEYQESGVPIQDLLLAGMQGVKNAAFAYNFNPNEPFADFAISVIRRHIELRIQTRDIPFSHPGNEYEEIHAKALDSHCDHCRGNGDLEKFLRLKSPKHRAHLFATAKINRCRKELIEIADHVEWKLVDIALHLPDDYDERDKFIRTQSYKVSDPIYTGECQDLVKPCGGEWCICTVNGEHIAISTLTDRESLHNIADAFCEILTNLMQENKILPFREWRATRGGRGTRIVNE